MEAQLTNPREVSHNRTTGSREFWGTVRKAVDVPVFD
jgi:hypothetical protein